MRFGDLFGYVHLRGLTRFEQKNLDHSGFYTRNRTWDLRTEEPAVWGMETVHLVLLVSQRNRLHLFVSFFLAPLAVGRGASSEKDMSEMRTMDKLHKTKVKRAGELDEARREELTGATSLCVLLVLLHAHS